MNRIELAKLYTVNGYAPFPLAPYSKKPTLGSTLQTIDKEPVFHEDNNIGLFPGSINGLRTIDADDERAKQNILNWLNGKGLSDKTTIVETPKKKGTHFWIRMANVPEWAQTFYNLPSDIGEGEFRLSKPAYCVAPGSILPEGTYSFVQGGIEAFLSQPYLEWDEVAWLASNPIVGPDEILVPDFDIIEKQLLQPPVRLIRRLSPPVKPIFSMLRNAQKGDQIPKVDITTGEILDETYPSRSEAEMGIITILLLSGYTFDEIFDEFMENNPGHFAEHPQQVRYLINSYNNAIRYLNRHQIQYDIASAYRHANLDRWEGITGEYDMKILLALLSKAWQFSTLQPSVSLREISEHAGISFLETIRRGLLRLSRMNKINIVKNDWGKATVYDVTPYVDSVKKLYSTQSSYNNTPPVSNVYYLDNLSWKTGELWSRNYLGGSAKLVYAHLSDKPLTCNELVDNTGKSRNTVVTALEKKLMPYGLAVKTDNGWIRGSANPERVAEMLNTKETVLGRQRKHEREREQFEEFKNSRRFKRRKKTEQTGQISTESNSGE